jgi:hypothetical protein
VQASAVGLGDLPSFLNAANTLIKPTEDSTNPKAMAQALFILYLAAKIDVMSTSWNCGLLWCQELHFL